MKKIIPILFLLIFSFSCKDTVKKESLRFDNLIVEKKVFASNDSTMPYMKLTLDFTYPVSFYRDTVLNRIQKIFVEAFAGEEYVGRSPKGAFEAYEKDLTDESLELASYLNNDIADFAEYFQTIKTGIVDSTENILTIKTVKESYAGGAHGSHTVLYYNIDLNDAELLTEDDLFKSGYEEKLKAYITEELQKKYGDRINDVLFEIDEIQSNNNFYFDKQGITYVYNEYEIAPYSEGIIEVLIPMSKIEGLLKSEYKPKEK